MKLEPEQAEGLRYVGLEHVSSWTGRLLPLDDQLRPEGAANAFEVGDVLFGKLRPYLAKAWCADFGGVCSTEFLVLKPRDYERGYLLYLLLTDGFVSYVDSSTYGAKMPRASWDFIGNSLLPLPPLDEQRGIAAFLDRETERIDSLIGKKRMLIERLREYWTALITRTVTRGLPPEAARAAGLDPSPRLKPSGVEWLGDVPEHWEVMQLGRVGTFSKGGGGTKEDEVDDGVPCVRYGDLYTQHRFSFKKTRARISEESAVRYTPIRYGDLLFAGSGETIEEIGKSAVNLITEAVYGGGDIIVFRPAVEIDASFLGYAADCSHATYQKSCMGRGVTVMHIYASELKRLLLPLPPLDEQALIADFLDQESDKIDHLVLRADTVVQRLQEYRTALITAAVTGKIDVRDQVSVTADRAE